MTAHERRSTGRPTTTMGAAPAMRTLPLGLSSAVVMSALVAAEMLAHTPGTRLRDDARGPRPAVGQAQVPITLAASQGSAVAHPEMMAGVWEGAGDPSAATDHLSIQMGTTADFVGRTWRLQGVSISGAIRLGRLGDVRISYQKGRADVEGDNRLRLSPDSGATGMVLLHVDPAGSVPIELDIVFDDTRQEWSGTFASSGLSKTVRFSRPGASSGPRRLTPLVGYWCVSSLLEGDTCFRVVERFDGRAAVWRDSVAWFYIATGPQTLAEQGNGTYGAMQTVSGSPTPEAIFFRLNPGTMGRDYDLRLSLDGMRLEGELTWPFSTRAPHPYSLFKSETDGWPASFRQP